MQKTRSLETPKATVEGEEIVGLACPWNSIGSCLNENGERECFAPNAFVWDGIDVLITREHNNVQLLGRISNNAKVWMDEQGLKYRVKPADTTIAADAKALIANDDLKGNSFTFKELESHVNDEGVRVITKAILYECGPVADPFYTQTMVALRSKEAAERQRWINEQEWLLNQIEIDGYLLDIE